MGEGALELRPKGCRQPLGFEIKRPKVLMKVFFGVAGFHVTGIVEEKDADDEKKKIVEINTGVMLCPGARLKQWLGRLSNDNAQGEYYLTDVIAMAVGDGVAVRGVKAQSQVEVMGINDKKQLAEAERALQSRLVDELMSQGVGFADPARVDIRGKLSCGKDVFIDVNAVFEGEVTLGDGVRIEANNVIRDSKLGAGVVVGQREHTRQLARGRAQARDAVRDHAAKVRG